MKQMSRGLYRLIVLFFLIIMAGLFISSLISTVVLSEFRQTLEDGTQEVVLNHSYYLADYPLVHFLLFSVQHPGFLRRKAPAPRNHGRKLRLEDFIALPGRRCRGSYDHCRLIGAQI